MAKIVDLERYRKNARKLCWNCKKPLTKVEEKQYEDVCGICETNYEAAYERLLANVE